MIPDNIWPCAFLLSRMDDGRAHHQIGAFLVRADTHDEAERLAQDLADQLCERSGFQSSWVCVNTNAGETSVMDLENRPCRIVRGESATITLTPR